MFETGDKIDNIHQVLAICAEPKQCCYPSLWWKWHNTGDVKPRVLSANYLASQSTLEHTKNERSLNRESGALGFHFGPEQLWF